MRIFLSTLFLFAGLLAGGILLCALYPERASLYVNLPETSLAGLRSPAFNVICATVGATSLAFLGYALLASRARGPSFVKKDSWAGTFQLAFSASVALVGVFLVAMVLVSGGWVSPGATDGGAVGTVFAVATLQAAVGTLLALALVWMSKSDFHYGATLTLHIMQCTLIGVVFYLGSSA